MVRPNQKSREKRPKKTPNTDARLGGVRKQAHAHRIVSKIDWEKWKPKLFELYITQNLTAQQVETEIALHGLQVS
jgi:hypothetical protein